MKDHRLAAKTFALGTPAIPAQNVYVERSADRELPELLRAGIHCNVHAGRQAGKTSLLRRAQTQLQANGHLCLRTALHVHAAGAECLFEAVERLVAKWAKDEEAPNWVSTERHGGASAAAARPLLEFIKRVTSSLSEGKRTYLLIDEADALLRFRPDEVANFLYLIREFCQEQSDGSVTLLFCSVRTLVDMTESYSIGGVAANFARDVTLPVFANDPSTRSQLISQGFPQLEREPIDRVVSKVLDLTGGQPFLTCFLLNDLQRARSWRGDSARLEKRYLDGDRSYAHLQSHFDSVRLQLLAAGDSLWSMVTTYQRILKEGRLSRAEGGGSAVRLENIGLVRVKAGAYEVACPIYERHLNHQWIEEVAQDRERSAKQVSVSVPPRRRSNRRIALLFTGGTAGMVTIEGKGAVFQGAQNALNSFVKTELREVADVMPVQLFEPLDGINVTPREWRQIADWIHKNLNRYDGFVIAHGTDTLAFTASALAFMFGEGLRKPIVFTGAQTTIDFRHGDTRDNLIRSCFVAAHKPPIREVQILFADLVLRAVRAEKADDRLFEGFRSPAWPPLARVTEHLLINDYALKGRPKTPSQRFEFRPELANSIVVVPIIPGLRPDLYRRIVADAKRRGGVDGVILTTPGVGNIPSTEGYSFRPFIQEAVRAGIPVLIASQVPINPYTQAQYEMARVPEEFGAILTGNITTTAAVAKFSWVIGCVKSEGLGPSDSEKYLAEIRSRMKRNYVGEQADEPSVTRPQKANERIEA